MATKGKHSSHIRKEKKVTTSSSNSQTIHKQSNLIYSVDDNKDKVPNYLKPTFSSRTSDSLKPIISNKIISKEDATLRRRSFDRPPSSAKSFISPDRKPSTPIPSSSRLPISTSTSKLVTQRNSKSFNKPIKSQRPAASLTPNRSSSSLSKNNTNLSKSPNTKTDPEIINKQSLLVQQEAEENVEREAVQVPNTETKEDVDYLKDDTQVEHTDDENPVEIISTVAERDTSSQVPQVNELQENETKHQEEEEEEEENYHIHSDNNHHLDEEGVADNVVKAENDEDKEEEKMNVNAEAASSEETIHEKKEDTEHVIEGSDEELIKSEEGKDHHDQVMEGNVEGEEEVVNEVQNPRGGEDKKEIAPTAYNDVIETTKNKLLGLRKNKVKALVGAFETVIDYETAASK